MHRIFRFCEIACSQKLVRHCQDLPPKYQHFQYEEVARKKTKQTSSIFLATIPAHTSTIGSPIDGETEFPGPAAHENLRWHRPKEPGPSGFRHGGYRKLTLKAMGFPADS